MLLINPPVTKPCEPPAGLARLAGFLTAQGVPCRLIDANLAGMLHLLEQPAGSADTWTRRAHRNLFSHLGAVRQAATYGTPDRYTRAANDLNRLLYMAGRSHDVQMGLADYRHASLSPLKSCDLLTAAEHPEDNPFHSWFSASLPEILETGEHGTVGLSLNYLGQALCAFAMAGFIRQRYPRLTIIFGGGLVTSWLRRPGWRNPFGGLIDHLIAGPGELPLLGLLGRELRQAPATPCYDSLPLTDYLSPGPILPYSSASGCYWNRCSFCPERAEGNSYQPHPVSLVLSELSQLIGRMQPVLVHLLDSAVSPALLRALADSPPGVPWYGFVRIGPELADPEFCLALRRSGCVMLKLGLESGDQAVLDRLNKGIDVDMAGMVLLNLQQAGIAVYLYLLFGTPAETVNEARRTLEFVRHHGDAISFLNLALFNMPAFGEEATEYDVDPFYEGDLSLYTDFRHPLGWGRREVRRFLDGEFKRDPAVASILRNTPPWFSSNHAPFFTGRTK